MRRVRPYLLLLLIPLVPLTAVRSERAMGGVGPRADVLYLWRGEQVRALFPGFRDVMADVYWLRTVQYFGGQRVFAEGKDFRLLEPLIEITITLDPRLQIAYRYGATFLSEPRPIGAGEPEAGVALLERAVRQFPDDWRVRQDFGFFVFLFQHDSGKAAEILLEAARLPGAPYWLTSLAGRFLVKGGERQAARQIWTQMYQQAEEGAIKWNARLNLQRLDALDLADGLTRLVDHYRLQRGHRPETLEDLARAGLLKAIPKDPTGTPFSYDPRTGSVTVGRGSRLWSPPGP